MDVGYMAQPKADTNDVSGITTALSTIQENVVSLVATANDAVEAVKLQDPTIDFAYVPMNTSEINAATATAVDPVPVVVGKSTTDYARTVGLTAAVGIVVGAMMV